MINIHPIFFLLCRVFSKFKEAIRLIPANIQRETALDASSARDIFPAIQPIYRYVKVRFVYILLMIHFLYSPHD